MLSAWRNDVDVVYYGLLRHRKAVITQHHRQKMTNLENSLIEKRQKGARRDGKMIMLHDMPHLTHLNNSKEP